MKNECKLPTDCQGLMLDFMKAKAATVLLKSVLSAVMMAVMSKAKTAGLTQRQEEQIYC